MHFFAKYDINIDGCVYVLLINLHNNSFNCSIGNADGDSFSASIKVPKII